MNVAQLERDAQSKADTAITLMKATMQTAEKENRLMTEDERAAINAKGDDARAAKTALDKARGDIALFDTLEQMAKPAADQSVVSRASRLSLGAQFVASDAGQFHRTRGHRSGSAWRSPSVELFRNNGMMATTITNDPASGGALVTPQYVPGIVQPTRRIVVADLFAQGTTNTGMVTFMREKTYTNAAAAVAQGAAKPESALVFEAATSKVEKVAHWLPVTEEMLEDVPQLQSYIDARLTLGVEIAEEDELLNGTGVSPHLLGILKVPGLTPDYPQPATGENNADTLAKQTLAVYTASFLMPDGYVLNPANWSATVLLKDGTNNYLVGNPFGASLLASSLWGLPVAVTPSIAVGTGLVGAFKTGAQIFRHGGIRVESSNSHQDYFVKNLVAIRAEERLALATYRPAAFGTVSALD